MNHSATRQQRRPRVVVLGAGFAGLEAVRRLDAVDVDVVLLDRAPYNSFQPLLYQVATGGLNSGDITYGLRAFASKHDNARFQRAHVTGLDTGQRKVHLDNGDHVEYDYLVIGSGVTANYFDIPGAAEHSLNIYTPGAALEVRDRLLANLEDFAQNRPGAVEPVVVIVGAGPTGVEMAGALAGLRNEALPRLYPEINLERVRVVLVEMTRDVLGAFDASLRSYAAEELRDRGVELRLDTAVSEVGPSSVVLDDGAVLPSAATIWATGVKVPDEVATWGLPQGRGGRIPVRDDLRVVGHDTVFAVGDAAANSVEALPQLAQPAIQGGRHAAVQIGRLLAGHPTQPFRYHDKGTMATIGRNDAVVQLPRGLKVKGTVAWVVWLVVHIVMLMSNRNRLATLANLSIRYFSWPRSINVIVGDRTAGSGHAATCD
jgi:NADH:ubiquinone reductase (H+-translocating)